MEGEVVKRVTRASAAAASASAESKKEEAAEARREERPRWLPDGWIVKTGADGSGKRFKHYISPVSGGTFNSKKEVLHSLEVTKLNGHGSNTTSSTEHNQQNVVQQVHNSQEWLPHGWILEIKTRLSGDQAGRKYKCYFDPFTGSRFYSKAEVFRFLKSGKLYTPTSTEKGRFKASATDNVLAQIEFSPDGLPQGWIKETVFRKSKDDRVRKDPYYTDPVSGYVFRSLKDAVHYVETGDLGKYSFGPRKKSVSELYSIQKESPPPIPIRELKSLAQTTRRSLFADEAPLSNGEMSMEIDDPSHKLQLLPPDNATPESLQKAELNSSSEIEHVNEKSNKKRRMVSDSATDSLVDTSENGELKPKKGRTVEYLEPATQSKENIKKETEELLEPPKVTENSSEPVNKITRVSKATRKQRRSKGGTVSLPKRSSKRLAGIEPAPTADLIIRRPSRQPASNSSCNGIRETLPPKKPEAVDSLEGASLANEKAERGNTSEDKPSSSSMLGLPFGDSWPDPCIEFAVKTLMGEIPVLDEGLAIEEYVQKQLSSVQTSNLNPNPRSTDPTTKDMPNIGDNGLPNSHDKASS